MKNLLIMFILVFSLYSCGVKQKDEPVVDIKAEKEAVHKVIEAYNKGTEAENWFQVEQTLAENVVFYGTDSAETIKSRAEFQTKLKQQAARYKIKYLSIVDETILMDDKGTVASVIYGAPIAIEFQGTTYHAFTRNAKNLRKENGNWLIYSGIIGIAASGPDFAVFLQRLSGKPDTTAPVVEDEKAIDKGKKAK